MKKIFVAAVCFTVLFAGIATAGTIVAMRGDGTVVFIDDQKEVITDTVVTGGVGGSMGALTPDGKLLYVANTSSGQYTTSIIDVEKRALIKNLETGPRPAHAYVSPDGKYVGVAHKFSENGKIVIAIIEVYSNRVKHRLMIDIKNSSYRGVLNPHNGWLRDSRHLLVPNWADNVTHVIDAIDGKEVATLQHEGNPHNYSTTSDQSELWVAVDAVEDGAGKKVGCGQLIVYDIPGIFAFKPVTTPKTSICLTVNSGEPQQGHHAAITRDGKYAYTANVGGGKGTSVNVYDIKSKKLVAHITAGGKGTGHPFMSPDGKYVFVGQYGANVMTIIDAKKHSIVKKLPVGEGKGVQWIAFTPDNKKAFINNNSDDAVYVVDMKTLKVTKKIVTAKEGKFWKTQWHVTNGWYQTYEVVETYIK
ncbi:MAG: cytochrome D1 domain-containing protein [Nitrospirota bacterium]